MKMRNIEVRIEIGEVSGYAFYADGNLTEWHNLTREEQVQILGAFNSGFNFFEKFLKEE